jgi:hypothetical protein
METIKLNGKEYNTTEFKKKYIEEYHSLNIYPLVGIYEREAGLLNDLAEAYRNEYDLDVSIKVYGNNLNLDFFKNEIKFNRGIPKISYIHESVKEVDLLDGCDIVLANEYTFLNNYKKIKTRKITIENLSKVLFINKNSIDIVEKYFWYYFKNSTFCYDNLICYTMIVKNAGSLIEKVLLDNIGLIDRWCILDTGSTDGTQEIIKRVLKNKKGTLYEEPFVDFKVSRNRCLELAGKSCKFIMMLDDTYSIRGDLRNFLNEIRGDQFSDSFSLLIQSEDNEYYSNRIIKSKTNLRYIHRIHEVIDNNNNVNVTIPKNKAIIFDNRSEYMEKRTMDRKQFDLQLLFQELEEFPDDPRSLYYIAQTYGCISDEVNKAKYFELRINHPVEGYVQEKIDAYFELARCYNFKIDCFTKLPLTKLTTEQWQVCERLYNSAYSLDKTRPDSLYFIGIHYYLEGDKLTAYKFMKQAFEVGYPINSQYSLKPTLSFHFLPKFLAELCYYFQDFKTGLDCSKLFLTSTIFNKPGGDSWNMMSNWYKIHENLCRMPQVLEFPKRLDLPIICFVTDGGWEPWTGSDIETKGLGGSETWIIEMAKHISRTGKYHVVVFCKTDIPRFYERVGYNPVEMFHRFVAENLIEHLIVSRYTEYIPVGIHAHAKNISIVFHDNLSPELIIPISPKIKSLFGLTRWHSKQIKSIFPQFETQVINYGVDQSRFKTVKKIANSFIYSSFPNRGLIVLLTMWPKIVKEFPDATLNIYCNLEQEWVNQVAPEMMVSIKKLLKINKTGVTVHGWVSKSRLADAWNTAEYFVYPCIFEETFCLTALEAAISKTCVISNGLAALSETARHGIIVDGNPLDHSWQTRCFEKLKLIMRSNNLRTTIVEKNYNWAKQLTWRDQANVFLEQLV